MRGIERKGKEGKRAGNASLLGAWSLTAPKDASETRWMDAPLHPCFACDKQAGAVQFEGFNSSASDGRFADDIESIIAPSKMSAPTPLTWVEERNNFARLRVRGFRAISFDGVADVTTKRKVGVDSSAAFGAGEDVVNGELFARDALLRLAVFTAATRAAANALGETVTDLAHRIACIADARLTISCSWRLRSWRNSFRSAGVSGVPKSSFSMSSLSRACWSGGSQ